MVGPLLCKYWFTSSVWNFLRWGADIPPGVTSLAARSEKRRLFSQAIKKQFERSSTRAKPHSWLNLSILEKLVITWPYIYRSTKRPSVRLILHIHIAIDWQLSNRVSADQYHLTVSRAPVSTDREYFLKLSADKLLVFKWSQAQVQFLLNS